MFGHTKKTNTTSNNSTLNISTTEKKNSFSNFKKNKVEPPKPSNIQIIDFENKIDLKNKIKIKYF